MRSPTLYNKFCFLSIVIDLNLDFWYYFIMKVYIVSTPIGNLADFSQRGIEVLNSVGLIACEDTRVSKRLLDHYDIKTKTVSYHHHSGRGKIEYLIDYLRSGDDLAVITDAGTPGISDPGNQLVAEVLRACPECEIVAVPGPSALIAALSISGLPTDKFCFLGFLPHKKGKETILRQIVESEITLAFYESPHRIIKTLERLADMLRDQMTSGGREKKIVVAREITKKFESVYRGNIESVLEQIKNDPIKGEFVVLIN